jgi:cytochrome c-type biogenesis protein CcmE
MQKKKRLLTAVIAITAVGLVIYFFRKKRDKPVTYVYTPPKGVERWEYTL